MIKKAVVDNNTPSIVSGKKSTKESFGEPISDKEKLNKKAFNNLKKIN